MTYGPSTRWDVEELVVYLHHETEKAWLVSQTNERSDAKWVPKYLKDGSPFCELEQAGANDCILSIPKWLAQEKGFV